MKYTSPSTDPTKHVSRGWRRRIAGALASLWAAGVREGRPLNDDERVPELERGHFVARVTWDHGRTWKGWPW